MKVKVKELGVMPIDAEKISRDLIIKAQDEVRKAHFSHYNCDICGIIKPIVLIDGKTKLGPWGLMCADCHKKEGVGIGTGKGQKYVYQFTDLSEITGEEVPIYIKVEG